MLYTHGTGGTGAAAGRLPFPCNADVQRMYEVVYEAQDCIPVIVTNTADRKTQEVALGTALMYGEQVGFGSIWFQRHCAPVAATQVLRAPEELWDGHVNWIIPRNQFPTLIHGLGLGLKHFKPREVGFPVVICEGPLAEFLNFPAPAPQKEDLQDLLHVIIIDRFARGTSTVDATPLCVRSWRTDYYNEASPTYDQLAQGLQGPAPLTLGKRSLRELFQATEERMDRENERETCWRRWKRRAAADDDNNACL